MCFSAEASFAVGTGLIPVGAYCLYSAIHKKPAAIGLALVPVFFGIQQISEGFVWHAIVHGDPPRLPSLVFLFFALALWPFWFSFSTMLMEQCSSRRWILIGMSLATTAWFWVLFYPLVAGPDSLLSIEQAHHSI